MDKIINISKFRRKFIVVFIVCIFCAACSGESSEENDEQNFECDEEGISGTVYASEIIQENSDVYHYEVAYSVSRSSITVDVFDQEDIKLGTLTMEDFDAMPTEVLDPEGNTSEHVLGSYSAEFVASDESRVKAEREIYLTSSDHHHIEARSHLIINGETTDVWYHISNESAVERAVITVPADEVNIPGMETQLVGGFNEYYTYEINQIDERLGDPSSSINMGFESWIEDLGRRAFFQNEALQIMSVVESDSAWLQGLWDGFEECNSVGTVAQELNDIESLIQASSVEACPGVPLGIWGTAGVLAISCSTGVGCIVVGGLALTAGLGTSFAIKECGEFILDEEDEINQECTQSNCYERCASADRGGDCTLMAPACVWDPTDSGPDQRKTCDCNWEDTDCECDNEKCTQSCAKLNRGCNWVMGACVEHQSHLRSGGCNCMATGDADCPRNVGDPHITTFDGLAYDFQAVGEFILVETKEQTDSSPARPLQMQVRTAPVADTICSGISFNTAFVAQVGPHQVSLYAGDPNALGAVYIDGVPTKITIGYDSPTFGDAITRPDESTYRISWATGEVLDVMFSYAFLGVHRLDIQMNAPEGRMDTVQGLWGTFNEDRSEDMTLRDGTILEQPVVWDDLYGVYADSWRIEQSESLFQYSGGETTDTHTDRSAPLVPNTVESLPAAEREHAEELCVAGGVNNESILDDCVLDVACTGDTSYIPIHARRSSARERLEVDIPWYEQVPGSGSFCCHVDCPDGPDPECGFVCGTGEFEAAHSWCDGDCPVTAEDCADEIPTDACTMPGIERAFPDPEIAAYICGSRCVPRFQSQCIDDDECCPTSGQCTNIIDNDCDIYPHVGSGCTEDDHCATIGPDAPDPTSVECLDEESALIFGGLCTVDCQEDSHCPDDTHCAIQSLYKGGFLGAAGDRNSGIISRICVPSCSSDDDCPREGMGCYDANGDGRSECWMEGTGDKGFGDDCELGMDCGEIGPGAVCARDTRFLEPLGNYEATPVDRRFCTQRCDLNGVECPDGWDCDPRYSLCIQPPEDDIGSPCNSALDCTSAKNNPNIFDRCIIDEEIYSVITDEETLQNYSNMIQGGYCTNDCADDSECPGDSRCAPYLYDNGGKPITTIYNSSICVQTCEDESDCSRYNEGCFDVDGSGIRVCWHRGTGNKNQGDECQWSSECGGIGEHAICRTQQDSTGSFLNYSLCEQYCGHIYSDIEFDCPSGLTCNRSSWIEIPNYCE